MTETHEQMLQRVQQLSNSYTLSAVQRQAVQGILAAYEESIEYRDELRAWRDKALADAKAAAGHEFGLWPMSAIAALHERTEERDELQRLIVDAHMKAFGPPRNYEYVDPRTTVKLLVADITATQQERDRQYEQNAEQIVRIAALEQERDEALSALIARERKIGAAEALHDICKDEGCDGGKAYFAKLVYRESPEIMTTTVGVVNANDIFRRADEIEKEARS